MLATSRKSISHHYEANGSNGPVSQSILEIRNIVEADNGLYICEASSDIFTEAVSVNFPVSITGRLLALDICSCYPIIILTFLYNTVQNECRIDNHGSNTPCQNGAICYDLVKGYTCTCLGNYQGINCEEEGIIDVDMSFRQSLHACTHYD